MVSVLAFPNWCWRPGGFPESSWSFVYTGILGKLVLTPVKEGQGYRIDKLASQSEGKHGENRVVELRRNRHRGNQEGDTEYPVGREAV